MHNIFPVIKCPSYQFIKNGIPPQISNSTFINSRGGVRVLSTSPPHRDLYYICEAKDEGKQCPIILFFLLFISPSTLIPSHYTSTIIQVTMSLRRWERQAQKGRDILEKSIPKQWLAPADRLPPVTQKSVLDFPRRSGLLSERELAITDMSATELVAQMGMGKLKAEEVVVAFLKRAVLGYQLVWHPCRLVRLLGSDETAAELCDGVSGRGSYCACQRA